MVGSWVVPDVVGGVDVKLLVVGSAVVVGSGVVGSGVVGSGVVVNWVDE